MILKRIFILIFSIAFLVQTFHQATIVADYYVNTGDYAQNCINKARPKLHCNGKCQMMKKLKKEAQKDQQNPERSGNSKKMEYCDGSDFASLSWMCPPASKYYNTNHKGFSNPCPGSVFHPPGSNC